MLILKTGAWWLAVFWLWMLLVGEWNRTEWIAAALAATLTTLITGLAWHASRLRVRIPARDVASAWSLPAIVVHDFGVVAGSLLAGAARGRVPRGTFVVRELNSDTRGAAPRRFGSRGWRAYVASVSPNAYPIDIDEKERTVLLHDLVPLKRSEEPIV